MDKGKNHHADALKVDREVLVITLQIHSLRSYEQRENHMTNFTPWVFVKSSLTLSLKETYSGKSGERYFVDLKKCTTSAEALDWIMQVAEKQWATDEVIASLVRALQYYLRLQQTLCSLGKGQGPIYVKKVILDNGEIG